MNLNWCVWLYIQGGGWWGCEKAVWMTKVGRVNANFHITLKPWVTLCLANSTGAALYNPTADPAQCTCLEHITCSNKNMKPCGNQTQQFDKNLITRAEIYKIRQNIPPPLPPLVLTLSRGTPWIEATDELFGRGKVIQRSLHSSTPPSLSHLPPKNARLGVCYPLVGLFRTCSGPFDCWNIFENELTIHKYITISIIRLCCQSLDRYECQVFLD